MEVLVMIVLGVFVAGLCYVFCLMPNTGRQKQMKPFEETYIAHRGLFHHSSPPENSLTAFRRAVEAGYGIELDVQLTADRKLVVFHDESLNRMCGVDRRLTECTYQELQSFSLGDSQEKIPLLQNVLTIVAGKVPLIIEIKAAGDCVKTARCLAKIMKNYQGLYCIESFHPLAVAWYKKNVPDVLRGQLSTNYWKNGRKECFLVKLVMTNLLLNFYAKPDFIAYHHKYAQQFSYRLCRRLFQVENAAWTIRSQSELEEARNVFQIFIFDSFLPQCSQSGRE